LCSGRSALSSSRRYTADDLVSLAVNAALADGSTTMSSEDAFSFLLLYGPGEYRSGSWDVTRFYVLLVCMLVFGGELSNDLYLFSLELELISTTGTRCYAKPSVSLELMEAESRPCMQMILTKYRRWMIPAGRHASIDRGSTARLDTW
jgi:hypothetical protein